MTLKDNIKDLIVINISKDELIFLHIKIYTVTASRDLAAGKE